MARQVGLGAAELLADSGAAASDDDFFRCPQFLAAEGVTHSLRVGDGRSEATLPVVVREIPGSDGLCDATSPYGYPGAKLEGSPLNPLQIDWSDAGIVSLFVRDRIHGEPCFTAPTERSVVLVSDPGQKRKSRMSDRQQIRRNEAEGYVVRDVHGPDASPGEVAALHSVYTETMAAVEAAERYLFDRAYFAALLSSPLARLFVVDGPGGDTAAAAIAVASDGAIHYYLSGTAETHRRASPSKNLISAVIDHADERGLPMSLGGGLAPGDALEQFKRGFGNTEMPYRTHEIVCDERRYIELTAGRDADGFFPAYRAPLSG